MLDARYWILDTRYSILDAGCWMLDARYWILDTWYPGLADFGFKGKGHGA